MLVTTGRFINGDRRCEWGKKGTQEKKVYMLTINVLLFIATSGRKHTLPMHTQHLRRLVQRVASKLLLKLDHAIVTLYWRLEAVLPLKKCGSSLEVVKM